MISYVPPRHGTSKFLYNLKVEGYNVNFMNKINRKPSISGRLSVI